MNIFTRFASWWAGISTLVAAMGTCPCCGGPPCVRGVAALGFLGALFSLVFKPTSRPADDKTALTIPKTK